jgi:hypothetical protein
MTLQPMLMTEATQAMKWASQYDKKDIIAKYLGDDLAGRGSTSDLPSPPSVNGLGSNPSSISVAEPSRTDELPTPPEKVPLPQSPAPVPQGIPLVKFPTPSLPKEIALPKDIPLPKEVPLPKTPSPPPPKVNPPPLLPSPAPSQPVNQKPVHTPAVEAAETPTAAPRHDAFTALPEPPSPTATPEHPSEPQPAVARKPTPSALEGKLVKKRQVGAGIKGIFGSRRVKDPSFTPPVSPPVENGPAVAAARAALAGNKPQPNGQPIHQIITQTNRETPSAAQMRSRRPLTPPLEPTYEEPESPPAPISIPRTAAVQHPDGAPKTRHASEDEGLSRVSTNEREQADREFSTFDQGPLLEQPAFVPPESPVRAEQTKSLEAEPSQQVPGTFTADVPKEESDESRDLTREISPVQDRWAQIRKNAADRAARLSEEQGRPSEAKTDDDETSGEESES